MQPLVTQGVVLFICLLVFFIFICNVLYINMLCDVLLGGIIIFSFVAVKKK